MTVNPDTKVVNKGVLLFKAVNGYNSSIDYLIIDATFGPVVLVVDGPASGGSSPTNSAEIIATRIRAKFDLPINQVFVEVYPDIEYRLKSNDWSVDLVQFKEFDGKQYCEPDWRPVPPDDPMREMIKRVVRAEYGK